MSSTLWRDGHGFIVCIVVATMRSSFKGQNGERKKVEIQLHLGGSRCISNIRFIDYPGNISGIFRESYSRSFVLQRAWSDRSLPATSRFKVLCCVRNCLSFSRDMEYDGAEASGGRWKPFFSVFLSRMAFVKHFFRATISFRLRVNSDHFTDLPLLLFKSY